MRKAHCVPFYQHDLDPVPVGDLQGQVVERGQKLHPPEDELPRPPARAASGAGPSSGTRQVVCDQLVSSAAHFWGPRLFLGAEKEGLEGLGFQVLLSQGSPPRLCAAAAPLAMAPRVRAAQEGHTDPRPHLEGGGVCPRLYHPFRGLSLVFPACPAADSPGGCGFSPAAAALSHARFLRPPPATRCVKGTDTLGPPDPHAPSVVVVTSLWWIPVVSFLLFRLNHTLGARK